MDDQKKLEIQRIFHEALDVPGTERRDFLERACGGDRDLLSEIEKLLDAYGKLGDFLSDPTGGPRGFEKDLLDGHPPEAAGRDEAQDLDLGPGKRIGPYRLLRRIGEGGFGSVWEAEQEEPLRRKVALKVIKLGMDTREVIARFETERQALAMMDHPNIARVFDAGSTPEGRPYFAMELVPGIPITEFCDANKLPASERLGLFAAVCRALQHAHGKGVIHRDIKPSNVLVTLQDARPWAKVIDFGIAKATDAGLSERTWSARAHAPLGTPAYMSPEQAGGSLDIDTRSDIYSLGVLLYELLTGTTPFNGAMFAKAAVGEIQRIIREEDPPTPSTRLARLTEEGLGSVAELRQAQPGDLRKLVSGDLDWIVMKALEKDRTRRYETAAALALDIDRYLKDEPVEAGPPGRIYRLRKFVRRHRTGVAATVLVVLAMLAGLAGTTYGLVRARHEAEDARTAREEERRQREVAESAMREAEKSALHARTVAALIQEMLLSADPHESKGKGYTVLQLLEDFTQEDRWSELSREPEVEIALRRTVGEAYLGLGDYIQAEPHVRRAMDLVRAQFGEEHLETARCMYLDGRLAHDQGRYGESIDITQKALVLYERILGRDHVETLTTVQVLSDAKRHVAEFAEGTLLAREAVEKFQRMFGGEHPRTLLSQVNLAILYRDQRNFTSAEPLFLWVCNALEKLRGRDHPHTLTARSNLAMLYMDEQRFEEAERIHSEVLQARRRVLGENHRHTILSSIRLGQVQVERKKYSEAKPLLEKAAVAAEKVLGEEHPTTILALNSLARLHRKQGKYADAEPLYKRVVDLRRRTRGEEHEETLGAMNRLGYIYRKRGRLKEAESILEKTYEAQRRKLGEGHQSTIDTALNLAATYRAQNRSADAEKILSNAVAISRKALGENHLFTLAAAADLANLLVATNRPGEAEPHYRSAFEGRRKVLGLKHPDTVFVARRLAGLYGDAGRAEEARAILDLLEKPESSKAEATTPPPENGETDPKLDEPGK